MKTLEEREDHTIQPIIKKTTSTRNQTLTVGVKNNQPVIMLDLFLGADETIGRLILNYLLHSCNIILLVDLTAAPYKI